MIDINRYENLLEKKERMLKSIHKKNIKPIKTEKFHNFFIGILLLFVLLSFGQFYLDLFIVSTCILFLFRHNIKSKIHNSDEFIFAFIVVSISLYYLLFTSVCYYISETHPNTDFMSITDLINLINNVDWLVNTIDYIAKTLIAISIVSLSLFKIKFKNKIIKQREDQEKELKNSKSNLFLIQKEINEFEIEIEENTNILDIEYLLLKSKEEKLNNLSLILTEKSEDLLSKKGFLSKADFFKSISSQSKVKIKSY